MSIDNLNYKKSRWNLLKNKISCWNDRTKPKESRPYDRAESALSEKSPTIKKEKFEDWHKV